MRWRDAVAQGLPKYMPDKPCKRGHWTMRRTHNPVCPKCSVILTREKKNKDPERYREYRRRTHLKHREKDLANNREWYKRNKQEHLARHKRWANENREKMREYTAKSYRKHHTKERARRHKDYHADPITHRARTRKYREDSAAAAQALSDLGIYVEATAALAALKEMGVKF